MKINHQLQKFIGLAIGQHNQNIRDDYNAKVDNAKQQALKTVEPLARHYRDLQKRRDELQEAITKVEKQITSKGFAFEGYSHKQTVVASDLKKLGYNIPSPAYRSEKMITAMLLAADEKEGKKILASIGVCI